MKKAIIIIAMVLLAVPAYALDFQMALWDASADGDIDMIEIALDGGANINARDPGGCITVINCRLTRTALEYAILANQFDAAKLLLKRGANANLANRDGWTSLEYAICHKKIKFVKLLLDHGANTEFRNRYKSTPLIYAAAGGNIEIVHLLIDRGALINAKNENGITALAAAFNNRNTPVVKLLMKHGAK